MHGNKTAQLSGINFNLKEYNKKIVHLLKISAGAFHLFRLLQNRMMYKFKTVKTTIDNTIAIVLIAWSAYILLDACGLCVSACAIDVMTSRKKKQ